MRIRGGAQLGEPALKASQGEGQPTGIKFSLFLTHASTMGRKPILYCQRKVAREPKYFNFYYYFYDNSVHCF
jgi:hypothetical protein